MSKPGLCLALFVSSVHLACGDNSTQDSASATTTITTAPPPTTTASPTTTQAPTTTAATTDDSGGQTGTTSTSTSTGAVSVTDSSASDSGPKFDLGIQPDAGEGCGGGGGGGMADFSYIWIANSAQGTISKIDTQTLQEMGRYIVRPDSAGSPSRTSVNLSGDVAVANRLGGLTKVYADPEDCQESNGMPGIQTSTDANFLPWGVEECIAWYTPFGYSTQRPVAWTSGELDQGSCTYKNQKVWTAGGQNSVADSLVVNRVNGDTGAVEETLAMPDVPIGYFGAYGGAVNQDGDFWFVIYDVVPSHLVHVDGVTLTYEKFVVPPGICPYGFTVDGKGRPWIGSFCQESVRFDPETQQWATFPVLGYGIQQDAMGRMWIADFNLPGLREIDSETLAVGKSITLPSGSVKGVSVDFYGYVWVVDMAQSAFRVDTVTDQYLSYDGLVGPYTYSDMTGWGLSNVVFPPG
ncbi:Vgb family protein [Nannocystis punicea]|uniref:Virginiamycin B lyase n=1 Tax=Nannocystis punicea TaxID=2995304 RepID=A0ABY7HD62_9BACT|nr:hypothetical protein [Nannocystis poenicansa]WAS97015.1 hypothetical protein O0S08_12775 [Nannocystis poenicansa]